MFDVKVPAELFVGGRLEVWKTKAGPKGNMAIAPGISWKKSITKYVVQFIDYRTYKNGEDQNCQRLDLALNLPHF